MKNLFIIFSLFLVFSTNAIADSICHYDGYGDPNQMAACVTSSAQNGDNKKIDGNDGVRLNNGTHGKTPIDTHGRCRYLDNNGSNDYFVPLKSKEEWFAFTEHKPNDVNTTTCARPHAPTGTVSLPNKAKGLYYGPTNYGGQYAPSPALPYARTGSSWPFTGANPIHKFTFSCTEGYWSSTTLSCQTKVHTWYENWDFSAAAGVSPDNATDSGSGWQGTSNHIDGTTMPADCGKVCTPPPTNGSCGSSNGKTLTVKPSSGLCNAGTATSVSGSGPWNWSCTGANGGNNVSCSALRQPDPINGSCGSTNGQTVATKPTSGLCSTGTAGSVSGSGPWNWSCTGSNGGSTKFCSANVPLTPINGVCGSANGSRVTSRPTTELCSVGSVYAQATTTAGWRWSCRGSNGGTNIGCSALKKNSCTPTACKSCNAAGNLVNKANRTRCGSSNLASSTAGWCLSGRCQAYFWDVCSGRAGKVRCWKSYSKGERAGKYENRSCSSCKKGVKSGKDSCNKCRNVWGSDRSGEWNNQRYF